MPQITTESTMARRTLPPPGEPKSKKDASPAFFPALNASHRTKLPARAFSRTSVQIVELSRDFMPSSKSLPRSPRLPSALSPQISNTRPRKNLEQPAQIDHQRQAVVVPQHSDAMRHIFRRLLEQILGVHRIRSDNFICGNADPNFVVMLFAAHGSDHHMLWQQPRAPAFCNRDINQRHDRSPQVENSHKVRWAQRNSCDQRPVQDLLHIQNRQTKSFAPASENAVLRFRRPPLHRT